MPDGLQGPGPQALLLPGLQVFRHGRLQGHPLLGFLVPVPLEELNSLPDRVAALLRPRHCVQDLAPDLGGHCQPKGPVVGHFSPGLGGEGSGCGLGPEVPPSLFPAALEVHHPDILPPDGLPADFHPILVADCR
jgi:hypothetical protein